MWPAIVAGIAQGAVYAAVALGLSLIFGVMKVVNFAHGSLLMIAMYVVYYAQSLLGVDPYVGILLATPIAFVLGYLLSHLLIVPLYRRERAFTIEPTSVLILTIGLWLIIDNMALFAIGSEFRHAKTALGDIVVEFLGARIPLTRLLAFGATLAVGAGLLAILTGTRLGRAMRATAQNRESAALTGIDVYRTYSLTFGLGAAATAVAGGFLLPMFYVSPNVGFSYDIRAFLIVVLGGMGSLPGTLIAGLLMGVTEAVTTQFASDTISRIAFFVLFVLVLIARPQGLLGRGER